MTSNAAYLWRGKMALRVWKVGRTVVLAFSIYQLGITHGMIYYAADPHAMEEQFIVKMVTEMGGNQLFPRHSKEFKMTDRVAKKILEGARHHCMLKLEELELLQYRLQLATEQISGSGQHISKGSPPQQKQLVSSSTSLASSVHSLYGEEGTEMKSSVEKGPLKFIKDVITAYLSSDGGDDSKITTNTSTGMVQSALHSPGVDAKSFNVPSKFDLPPNSKRRVMKTFLKRIQLTAPEMNQFTMPEIQRHQNNVSAEIAFWKGCLAKLRGDWSVVLFNAKAANAFVTPLVPKKIFVSQGMLESLSVTEDELSLILAHEVSHLLLDHTHDATTLENFINMAYLVILTSIGADFLLLTEFIKPALTKSLVAANSREHESEADWLGMMVASRSCVDVQKAAYIMKKMSDMDTAAGRTSEGWTDTHPLSSNRYKVLLGLAKEIHNSPDEYNPRYDNTMCSQVSRRLFSLGRG